MAEATTQLEIKDLKGIRKLMIAPLMVDTEETITWGTPIPFAGAQEVSSETEEDSATKYYDNAAAIVNNAEGADVFSITCSVVPDAVRAVMEGRVFVEATGEYAGTPMKKPYLALGFVGMDTNDEEYCYWIYKTKMTGGGETYATRDDGTDSNGQEYEATSIYTNHKFTKVANKQPMKFYKVPLSKTTEETFFANVATPDTLNLGGESV